MAGSPNSIIEQRLSALVSARTDGYLRGGLVGLEKESLRVTAEGGVSPRSHPVELGSALSHPWITTDFSEALIELITPPCERAAEALSFLEDVHAFVQTRIGGDLLWATSMPCQVSGDESVPLARYGASNVGMMKHVYRRGLGHRYGRVMQAIAGVHYNYSPPDALWPALQEVLGDCGPEIGFRSARLFGLIRNFQRLGWTVPYFFGSSPSICRSFLGGRDGGLDELSPGTLYLPHATSLRMSDLGYKNKNQAGLDISYDGIDAYVESLTRAIETPYPDYERIGVKVDGEYRQLNANILQIENEYYSFIRPKQIAHSGERPTRALERRGVAYIEMRALDVSPFHPAGVGPEEMHFLEAFLLSCLLAESDPISPGELEEINENQRLVALDGRNPDLVLGCRGRPRLLREWAREILDGMTGVCALLDGGSDGAHRRALDAQFEALADPSRLPSTRILETLRTEDVSFFEFAMQQSREHQAAHLARRVDARREADLEAASRESIARQAEMEADDEVDFDEYLRRYFADALAPA